MTRLDPAEELRRSRTVLVMRRFSTIYLGLSLILFGVPLIRALGLPAPTGVLQTMISGGTLIALVGTAGWLVVTLIGLGQYRLGHGARFDFWAAVTRSTYLPVGKEEPPSVTTGSPLEVLRADTLAIHPELVRDGHLQLGESLLSGLATAESVARVLELHPDNTTGVVDARAAVGRFSDHVLVLSTLVQQGSVDAVEQLARFETDLRELRSHADSLRDPSPRKATG